MTTTPETAVNWPAWEDAAFYNQDPDVMYPSIAAQRRAAPVYWYEPPGYPTGFWVLSKYDHQRFVASHPEIFSSQYGFAVGDASDPSTVTHQLPEWAKEKIRHGNLSPAETRRTIAHGKLSMGDPEFESLMITDPPRHGQIRNIMMKALRPSLVRAQKPRIAEIAEEFLDQIEPGAEVDFVTTIGQIPAALMTELIGVPRDMRKRFIEMSSVQMLAISINPDMDRQEAARIQRVSGELHDYCAQLLAERKASGAGGDDLVSCIASSEYNGGPVPLGMAISFIHTFVNAGETTRSLLSLIMLLLAQHPDQRRLLVERPELVPNAVEETLRFNPLNWSGCRTALQDIEVGGQLLRKDDYVVMAYASGNRDEDIWARPDDYDITRTFDHDHQGFGYGEHSCPGALLARTDSVTILQHVVDRFPQWELAGPALRWSNPFIQGVGSLPLRFSR